MKEVFIVADNIYSPIGNSSAENMAALKRNQSGIAWHENPALSPTPFFASLFDSTEPCTAPFYLEGYTRFEQLMIASIQEALKNTDIDPRDPETALIISSTKGNIGLIETEPYSSVLAEKVSLHHSAKKIAGYFHSPHQPIVVSNACISGLLALLTGMRLIQSGQFKHAVVAGCDLITKFILSGFQSFMAISNSPCKPFDAERDGISLGEAAATVILSSQKKSVDNIRLAGGSVSNDANHISGPSRTGEELALAIRKALAQSGIHSSEIDFISAHGTATIYNDEMEAKAIDLTGMESVPVNSLKGNYGHTLGAAGLVESIASIHSLKENIVLPTKNFSTSGVSKPLHICSTLQTLELRNALKTASGFGGCNAALVFSK
ncbi:MAG: beta-ketoacyl synthase [Bacteroidetes bacterium]|nr:beta-ketoacyl synthase [Bacteroidota bacterium]